MAADDRLEGALSSSLRVWLDPVAGPHPTWIGSPARLAIASVEVPALRSRRRPTWPRLLIAAVVVLLALVAAFWAGGRLEQRPSIPAPDNGLVTAATERPPTPSPSGPPTAPPERPSPSQEPAAAACLTHWSHTGIYPAGGLQDGSFLWNLDGSDGRLYMSFLNAIDTVEKIMIAPTEPPFHEGGRSLKIAGTAFFKLTIRGLTRATEITRDDMKATDVLHGPGVALAQPPIAEARRIHKPRRVSGDPDQSEVWIIGVDYPACLAVTTLFDPHVEEVVQPGDDVIIIRFDRVPSPSG